MDHRPKNYGLLIAINYFGTDCELMGCHNDIDDVLNRMNFDNVVVLKDDVNDRSFMLPQCPTRANIIAMMELCAARCVSGDTLYIHYSGHGSNVVDKSGDERDGRDECICPVDCNINGMITDDVMRKILVEKLCSGVKLRVIFDCCHSGSGIDLPVRWISGRSFATEIAVVLPIDVIFISGCQDPDVSADSVFDGRNNGALTAVYLICMKKILSNPKIRYSWQDLGEMMRLQLKKLGYTQIPQISMMDHRHIKNIVDIVHKY